MNISSAVVPVAGLGTRLLPMTAAVAKELLPLGQKPTLQYVAEELSRSGIGHMLLVSTEAKKEIANFFGDHSQLVERLRATGKPEILDRLWSQSNSSLDVDVVIQHEQLGLGHAVFCSAEMVQRHESTHFVVSLGDCVIGVRGNSNVIQRMKKVAESNNADIVIAFEQVPDEKVSRYGIAKPKGPMPEEGVFELADVVEKPALELAPSNLAISARYLLPVGIFDVLKTQTPGHGGEIQLTDAIRTMIGSGCRAFGVKLGPDEKRFDVGNFQSYTEAFVQFALDDPELRGAVLKGVSISEGKS